MSATGRLRVSGRAVVNAHTCLALASFCAALAVGLALHYRRIVKNGVAGYPLEWWPSVSATIGDWFPERNVFQVFIALTAGPRFLLVTLCALQALRAGVHRASALFAVGILRTISCGGWMFITSSDHALAHDTGMGLYLALTPIWMLLCSTSLGSGATARRIRKTAAFGFYACVPFMIHFYLEHKARRVPGAYSVYALFEWTLVFMDVLFDHAAAEDVGHFEVTLAAPEAAPKTEEPARAPPSTTLPTPPTIPTMLSHLTGIYLSFLAWSAWTVLPSTIFYFSVSNMGVEGHEAFIVSQAAALALVALPPLSFVLSMRTLGAPATRHALWYAVLAALPVYASPTTPFVRLVCAGVSSGGAAVVSAIDGAQAWAAGTLVEHVAELLLGLLALIVAKYWNHGNSPVWPYVDATNGGHHLLFFNAGMALLFVCGPARRAPGARVRPTASWASFAAAAAALGAWLIETHTLLSDSGTLIAWCWDGYPVSGPLPVTHGVYMVAAVAASIVGALCRPRMFASVPVFVANALGTAALLHLDGWPSFAGALTVALTLPGMAVPLAHAVFVHAPLVAMLGAWIVYSVLEFLDVLTVAYAFLPGAHVMRERTGTMLVVQHVLIGAGLVAAWRVPLQTAGRAFRRSASVAALALVAAAALVPWYRAVAPTSIAPHFPDDRVLTAGIWTVHFGFDQSMRDNSRRMADILRTLKMDMVGLLETDLHRPVFGNRDLSQYLAEELRMYVDLGPSPKKHTWGAVLLSKFPIINSTHHLLPSPHGELAPAIHAVVDIFGVPTHVVVSHNGQEEDRLDRELQTTAIARILRDAYPHPAIFLGYVVTKPHAARPAPYPILFEDGRILDVDPSDKDRWCQYLGFRGLERVGYARVSRYTVTDTELQTFKLRVPHEPITPDHDVRPVRMPSGVAPVAPWSYPNALVKTGVRLNETHKYSPYMFPQYFEADSKPDSYQN